MPGLIALQEHSGKAVAGLQCCGEGFAERGVELQCSPVSHSGTAWRSGFGAQRLDAVDWLLNGGAGSRQQQERLSG